MMRKSRPLLGLLLAALMVLSLCTPIFAAHTTSAVSDLEKKNSELSMSLATQGYTLLKNNGVLPLREATMIGGTKRIALFGPGALSTIPNGTGSGDVTTRKTDAINAALRSAGWRFTSQDYISALAKGTGEPRPEVAITDAMMEKAKTNCSLALYCLSRQAGEGTDRTDTAGDFRLTATELSNIKKITQNFDRVVLVFNTMIMDVSWMEDLSEDAIDGIIFMAQGGMRGSEALVKILEGKVTPSGKLTDTWPKHYSDYPSAKTFAAADGNSSTEYYEEGIYVGYRYFDTFGIDVAYPFGFGLSYTTFSIEVKDVDIDEKEVKLKVLVTNTGDLYPGREVVQVYFSAPDGTLEKPYQELATYGKTDTLAPGEKQVLELKYATADMSSYSQDKAAYILEPGQYIIRVGNSSRNTKVAAVANLDAEAITEQLSNQVQAEVEFEELSKKGHSPIKNNDTAEIPQAESFSLSAAKVQKVNNASPYDSEEVTTYLFEEDRAAYQAREQIELKTRTVAGTLSGQKIAPDYTAPVQTKASGQHVKLTVSNASGIYGFSIWEFTIYGKGADGVTRIISQNKPVVVSDYEGDYTTDTKQQPGKYVNDGKWGTRWASGYTPTRPESATVEIDLEDTYEIEKLAIDWEYAYGKDVKVEVAPTDKSSWTTIFTYQNYDGSNSAEAGMTVFGSVGGNSSPGGFRSTTYKEKVEVVPDLPAGITKENATLTDVYNDRITMKQFLACLTAEELARLCMGGEGYPVPNTQGRGIEGQPSAVRGQVGTTTHALYQTRHIPAMPNANGPAGVYISQAFDQYEQNQACNVEGTGSHIRLSLGSPSGSYGFSIYEITVYGYKDGEETPYIISRGKPTTASSEGTYTEGSTKRNYVSKNVNDGDYSTRWGSNYVDEGDDGKQKDAWIAINLQESYHITRVEVAWEAAYSKEYDIQVSNNGTSWHTLDTVTNDLGRGYQYCTGFPVGLVMAMTWDTEAIRAEGLAVGAEMKDYGVTAWLAPGMNIHRDALCGRNFEYYSEDPLVAGMSAASITAGVQSYSGIGVTIKHFWGNNQETNRTAVNNIVSERAAREIYLKGFEIAVKQSQPMCLMTSYNGCNGWPGGDSHDSCTDILRGEWGFKGYVMTDWGGGQSTPYISMHAGNDVIMQGGDPERILIGYYDGSDADGEEGRGTICLGDLQQSAEHLLNVLLQTQDMEKLLEAGFGEHYEAGPYSANHDAPLTTGAYQAKKYIGDVDGSGVLTVRDATRLLTYLEGKTAPLAEYADVNLDGSETVGDVSVILKRLCERKEY